MLKSAASLLNAYYLRTASGALNQLAGPSASPLWPSESSSFDSSSHLSFTQLLHTSTHQCADASSTSAPESSTTSSAAPDSAPGFATATRKVNQFRATLGHQASLEGIVHIQNTLNNIIMTLTDKDGNVKAACCPAAVGFRNARKSQPVAAEKAAEELAKKALKLGYTSAVVKLKGMGNTKQYAVQAMYNAGLNITHLMDVTPIPYNGCRRPKKRRV